MADPVTTIQMDPDFVWDLRRRFESVLALTADEVGVHGAVYVDDDGFITVRDRYDWPYKVKVWLYGDPHEDLYSDC
jgi:hypothetical protein